MTIFIVLFHVIACLTLILVVLLQAGNESGLSGALGGGSTSDSVFGAKSNAFLTKFTSAMAILFMVSSLSLAIYSAKKNKSVMLKKDVPAILDETPVTAKEEATDGVKATEEMAKEVEQAAINTKPAA